jgi:acyl-CoA thioesterase I
MLKVIACVIFIVLLIGIIRWGKIYEHMKPDAPPERYVAIGDSYTYGEGAMPEEAWPYVLTEHLKNSGISITLVANLGVNGYTTQDVIDDSLGQYEKLTPTFATLLIGANDLARGVPPDRYRENVSTVLDRMQAVLPDKRNILIVTIPDFSLTPYASQYSGLNIPSRIQEFNSIMKDEAGKRKLPVAEIFELSQTVRDQPDLISSDGLHPSAKQYSIWELFLYPLAKDIIRG